MVTDSPLSENKMFVAHSDCTRHGVFEDDVECRCDYISQHTLQFVGLFNPRTSENNPSMLVLKKTRRGLRQSMKSLSGEPFKFIQMQLNGVLCNQK